MSSKTCSNCGGADIDRDAARGDAVCTSCGTVLEDNIIVSEVQFEENAYGGSSAIGQFVSADNQGGTGFINSYRGGGGKESRELTLRKARDRIQALSHQLRLNQHCIDMACNFYKMALCRHLTHGRKNPHVVAACVYITCRTEGTPHLLIDIADVMDIDVYRLGHTFMQLSKTLCINIPSVDPCMYVMRFANRMEFGEKTHDVSMTALRLVQRMKRDWIHTGRKPSGLCGAALLIAGRMHGFNRAIGDIIKEVKVHENTVRKRLLEFGETPTSLLTLEEFMTVDLEEEQDPPAFRNSRKKDREKLAKLADGDVLVEEELEQLEKEIERQLAERQAKARGPWAKYARETSLEPASPAASPAAGSASASVGRREEEDMEAFLAEETLGVIEQVLAPAPAPRDADAETMLMPPPNSTYLQLRHHLRPSMASLGISEAPLSALLAPVDAAAAAAAAADSDADADADAVKSEELDLTGIDEDEIDTYLLTDKEATMKTSMWMKLNGEFLQELEEKRKRKAEEEEEKQRKGEKRKRRTCSRKPKSAISASTPAEAIEKMLQEKRISNKINYEVLKNLNLGVGPSAPASKSTAAAAAASASPSTAVEETKPARFSFDAKPVVSARKKTPNVATSTAKATTTAAPPSTPPPPAAAAAASADDDDVDEDVEDEEEDADEDAGGHLSAANLLRQFHGADDGYDAYGNDEEYY